MIVTVLITDRFKTAAKPLLRKYPSLSKDLIELENDLRNNPKLGTNLGNNVYKIRLRITSKGKGKSGGARVISLVESTLIGTVDVRDEDVRVNLITIYDKSDVATITDKELKNLIKTFYKNP